MSENLVELTIEDLAFDGKAVARLDGKVVFCNGGLPGERVRVEIVRTKPRYHTARVHEIIRPSDERIAALCTHFGLCGGCSWQDLLYEHQLAYKKNQVGQCLARLGGLPDVAVHDVLGCTEPFRYRNKMEFSFNTRGDGEFTLGLHRRGHWEEVFDLEHCHLCSETVNEVVDVVRRYVGASGLSIYDVTSHEGYFRFLVFREARRTGQLLVNLVTNYGELPDAAGFVETVRSEVPAVTTIIHNENGQKANIATGEKEHVLFGPGFVIDEIAGLSFEIRANSFFQTNTDQAEKLYATGLGLLNLSGEERLLDLYCGTGTIGILASSKASEVLGVELVDEAVAAAERNAALNKIENIRFQQGDVKAVLREMESESKVYDTVVVDPPRAGLNPKALKVLLRIRPEKLLYISCNPATFARDAKQITAAGYSLGDVHPVDMFPHTMHIELTAVFARI
jgi:23S rRNA (uracil1939-C5)-methyltransferase